MKLLKGQEDGKKYGEKEEEEKRSKFTKSDCTEKQAQQTSMRNITPEW